MGVTEYRACCLLNQPRSTQRHRSATTDDKAKLVERIVEMARTLPQAAVELRELEWNQGHSASLVKTETYLHRVHNGYSTSSKSDGKWLCGLAGSENRIC